MGPQLYHVGIAVRDLDAGIALYRDRIGLSLVSREVLPERSLEIAILDAGGCQVELLQATGADSVIARFIAGRGEGLHHIAFSVEDLKTHLDRLAHEGLRLIDRAPRPGASGTRVGFIHPRSTLGALLELVEEPNDEKTGDRRR